MLWIYGVVGGLTGLIAGAVFYLLTKNKATASLLAGIAIVLVIAATKEYVMPAYYAKALEQNLRSESPFMNMVAKHSPKEFNLYIAEVKNNMLANGDKSNNVYYSSELINSMLIKYGSVASNDSLYQYLIANLALDKQLFSTDPMLVLALEFPEKFKGKINPTLLNVTGNTKSLLDAKIAVIQSAMEQPAAPLTDADKQHATDLLREVITDLSKQYGTQTIANSLQHPDSPSVDKKAAAQIIISFYEDIVAKGKDNAALIIKLMLTHQQAVTPGT